MPARDVADVALYCMDASAITAMLPVITTRIVDCSGVSMGCAMSNGHTVAGVINY